MCVSMCKLTLLCFGGIFQMHTPPYIQAMHISHHFHFLRCSLMPLSCQLLWTLTPSTNQHYVNIDYSCISYNLLEIDHGLFIVLYLAFPAENHLSKLIVHCLCAKTKVYFISVFSVLTHGRFAFFHFIGFFECAYLSSYNKFHFSSVNILGWEFWVMSSFNFIWNCYFSKVVCYLTFLQKSRAFLLFPILTRLVI